MWNVHEGMGWWMVFGGILTIIFWVAIVWLVVWGVSALVRHRGSSPTGIEKRDPLNIAKERYARGEITKEQFEQIKKDLS